MRKLIILLTLLVPALLAGCTAEDAKGALDGAQQGLTEAKDGLAEAKRTLDETKAELEDLKARYDLLKGTKVLATETATVGLNVTASPDGALSFTPNVTTATGTVPAANVTRIDAVLLAAATLEDGAPDTLQLVGCEVLACRLEAPSDGFTVFHLDGGDHTYRVTSTGTIERWSGEFWAGVGDTLTLELEAPVQYYMAASDFADRVRD